MACIGTARVYLGAVNEAGIERRHALLKKTHSLLILALLVFCLALIWAEPALAVIEHYYQGNMRDPGYGVKANIGTPGFNPFNPEGSIVCNFVSNYYQPVADVWWVQCGWIDGNGVSEIGGVVISQWPRSYREANAPAIYDFDLYSQQANGTVRTYESVYTMNGQWKAIIQSVSRGEYGLGCTKTLVEALSELIADQGEVPPPNEDWASFRGVQYKGQVSYMNFNQWNFWNPYVAQGVTWFDTDTYSMYQYDTYTN